MSINNSLNSTKSILIVTFLVIIFMASAMLITSLINKEDSDEITNQEDTIIDDATGLSEEEIEVFRSEAELDDSSTNPQFTIYDNLTPSSFGE